FEPHILVNSRMTSSHTSLVTSVLSMSKPVTSRLPAPRPVPNSKRPSLRWSSIATRSATRAGWFTRGFRLKIPEPRWMRSGADDHLAHHTSLGQVGERVGNTLEGHLARDRGVDAAGREELHQLAVHVEHERAARIVAAVRAHVHAHDRVVAEQHDVRRHLRH